MPKRVPSVRQGAPLPPAIPFVRPSSGRRGYDADWLRLRRDFIAANSICSTPGCGRASTDVDHRVTVRDRPDLRLDRTNLIAYCHPCHSRKTASRDGGFGNRRVEKS